jgi:CRISPR-associated protein Csb2
MTVLTLGWEYLTGYAVATDPSSRDRAEWPPHPGRVFMAMAAAWFETGEDPAEGDALRWLEALGDPKPPDMHLPTRDDVFERSAVTVYVPVNDKAGPAGATLQSAPAITRSKQPRTFPRVWVGHDPCYMVWPNADGVERHRQALDRLCSKVTRIGHSSSLVRMWVADEGEPASDPVGERWIADDELADHQVRKVSSGTLDMLAERFNASARHRHTELMRQIEALKGQRKAVKGRETTDRKAAIDAEVESLRAEAEGINPRMPLRPSLGLWSGYRLADRAGPGDDRRHSHFDTDVLVMVYEAGLRLSLASTLAVTQALRGAVMSHSGVQPVPAWVSGHEANGEPLRSADDVHLASIPLSLVSRQHADGHLLGVGLVFPRSVPRRERGRVLGKLLLSETGEPRPVALKLGRLGEWTVLKRGWNEKRWTLAGETWTAHHRGAVTWASVTPVVLDRFPKSDRLKDRLAWTHEVVEIVVAACARIGLPEPCAVDIDTTSWHLGSPRAACKRRLLRGHAGISTEGGAIHGDGFPPFPVRGTNSPRPQVHVWLRFSEPVIGPVLLGAGRYLGYGLCSPLRESPR